jgi:hypothetical protein
MPLTTSQTHEAFRIIGKLIHLSDLAPPQVIAFRKAAMGLVDQGVDGDADEFEWHQEIATPATAAVSSVNAALNQIPVDARASIESYLSRFLAPQLNLAVGTPATSVIDTLVGGGMQGETVLESGKLDSYFNTTWGKQLPTATTGNETLPDTWVTSNVV